VFNLSRVPVWKRRVVMIVVSVIYLAISWWRSPDIEDRIITIVFVCIANVLPIKTEKKLDRKN
jgi:hypothetical protein